MKLFKKPLMIQFVFLYAALLTAPGSGFAEPPPDTETLIDPHFTGKNCDVCHSALPEVMSTDKKLKFKGDDIAMCNSCHDREYLRGDLHPVGIMPGATSAVTIPAEFPLFNGRLTCRTCHQVYLQCVEKPAAQYENLYFLRGGPYEKTVDLCFKCHPPSAYTKINPHEQVSPEGILLEKQCLYCHQSLPEPEKASGISDVRFLTQSSTFCAACHGNQEQAHPANATHMTETTAEMRDHIRAAEKRFQVSLPLFNGKIFCGTCHNPHDRNVIQRKAAAKGAAAENKLRLDWAQDLCVACHPEKENITPQEICMAVTPAKNAAKKTECRTCHETGPVPDDTGGPAAHHKSFIEKKCRACHRITREQPEPPVVYKMCFLSGCHDTGILNNTFKHPDALQANCLFCHNQHGSRFGAHIVNDQQKLCKACHTLLSGTPEAGAQSAAQDLHAYYYGLMARLLPDQEASCSFCHGADHSNVRPDQKPVLCYRCHNAIRDRVIRVKGTANNIHETLSQFADNKCTFCHDPHSSPHPALLKQERDTYR